MSGDEAVPRRGLALAVLPAMADGVLHVVEERFERTLGRPRRPPGAVREAEFLLLCTRCNQCVRACPQRAVFRYTNEAGPVLAGTPVMLPDKRPCHMCVGFPCADACPEGALEIPQTDTVWLGLVRIRENVCIAFRGPECGACAGLCPEGIRALEQESWRPVLDAGQCVGCGKCIEACPTDPPAIELMGGPER